MSLIVMLIWLAIIGVVVWLLITYVPMPQPFKSLIVILAVLICVLWILESLGIPLGPNIPTIRK